MHAPEDGCLKFCDLNLLQHDSEAANLALLQQAEKLGYQCVAFNTNVVLETKNPLPAVKRINAKEVSKVQVLYRLTVAADDVSVLHSLSNPVALGYDILAITPLNDRVFLQACSCLPVDIVAVHLEERLDFHLKRHQVKMAVDRGLHFEISYHHLIRGESGRCHTIANGRELAAWAKGKNTILSSGTSRLMELRGPYDVANLGHVFGLKGGQCKDTIARSCMSVISHADMRLHSAKGVVSCEQLPTRATTRAAASDVVVGTGAGNQDRSTTPWSRGGAVAPGPDTPQKTSGRQADSRFSTTTKTAKITTTTTTAAVLTKTRSSANLPSASTEDMDI